MLAARCRFVWHGLNHNTVLHCSCFFFAFLLLYNTRTNNLKGNMKKQPPQQATLRPHKPLTTRQAVKLAGNKSRLARALGILPSSVTRWGECPPLDRQDEIRTLYGVQA